MRLQRVSLLGRRFAIQYGEIIDQFGRVIPWLDGLSDLGYVTNSFRFRDALLRGTRQPDGTLHAYQFVTGHSDRVFVGGMLGFDHSPERLADRRNRAIAEQLVGTGHRYISCFQIRRPFRSLATARRATILALQALSRDLGPVWGVVSDPRMRDWHRSLGAVTPSPLDNKDRLWIVQWTTPPTLRTAMPPG